MNWHDSGGAAFPIPHSNEPHAPCAEHGMTLRDWFAGKANIGETCVVMVRPEPLL
jgi:hypothetical protein